MNKDFRDQLSAILKNYSKDIGNLLNGIAEELAIEAAQKLKEKSPRSKGRHKHYADSWMITQQKVGFDSFKYIVHNKKGQLTQLLERSHPMRNGKPSKAYKHIGPVNDWVHEEYKKRVEQAIEGKGVDWSWMKR